MKIKVYADTICGWCFIGQTNLEKALEDYKNKQIEVEHVPFQLNPDMPESGISRNDYLNIKFGGKKFAAPMYASMTQKAKEVGLNLNLEKIIKTPNTVLSHLLILLAKDSGKENQIKKEIYTSYFIMGEDIGDENVLFKIAERNNISKEKVINYFSEINKNKIYSYQNIAKGKNISGVPFFEINDQYVSGAQSSEYLKNFIKENLN
ncbi:DsbA family oxidoreductase [Candidatus Pelagibacter sp.]|uniref:DsbA family oxidoreductase n=1 Tax=Candidatus Pelagibacter sp. TaxID=2024849 RepID=UPI003F84FC29